MAFRFFLMIFFPIVYIYPNQIQFIVTYPLKTITGTCHQYEFIDFKIEKEGNRYKAQNFKITCEIKSMKTGDPNRDSNMYATLGYPNFKTITVIVYSAICENQNCKIDFELDLSGKRRQYQIQSEFRSEKGLFVSGGFSVNLLDFSIEPPKLLFLKIDSIVKVTFNFSFDKEL